MNAPSELAAQFFPASQRATATAIAWGSQTLGVSIAYLILPGLGSGPSKNHTHTPPHHAGNSFDYAGDLFDYEQDGGTLEPYSGGSLDTFDTFGVGGFHGYQDAVTYDGGGASILDFGPHPSPPKPHHNGSHPHKPPHHNNNGMYAAIPPAFISIRGPQWSSAA